MDTARLKRFATEARIILMQGVKHRLQALGFDLSTGYPSEMPQQMEGGAVFMGDIVSSDFYKKWMSLNNNIHNRSIKDVAEEAAYTWFNRLMAIRIMAKQNFIAPVLKYESEDIRVPVIVSEARKGRLPGMTEAVRSRLMELLDDDSKTNEQFALLIVAYCHENPIINNCFGAIADYTELLLPQNILSEGGFVDLINHTDFISDEQYASAELIGWLYQFYISDRKDEAFAKKGKYDADEIAPATQIFTPNWIVKYMAENTLGRIYIDNNPYCDLKDNLKYLVDVQPSAETLKISDLSEMKVADLACGSGHILNECFDLLYKMYVEEGYSRQQAIKDILQKNITGIDLDTRAKQLATFALLMKACQKDHSFLNGKVMPHVFDMPRPIAEVIPSDSDTRNAEAFLYQAIPHYMLGSNDRLTKEIADAILLMDDADTLGSIMKFNISEATRNALQVRTREYEDQMSNGEIVPETIQVLIPYMNIILALTEKYAAICMNPPYMGSGRFDNTLSTYVKNNYPRSKTDLFAVFMDVAINRLALNGKYGMINMHSWMFLSSFEELRNDLLDNKSIDSLLHLGPRTFDELSGEVVQNAAFVITNITNNAHHGTYFRLVDGINCGDKEFRFLRALKEHTNNVYYPNVEQSIFKKIPGQLLGYWFSENAILKFEKGTLGSVLTTREGMATADNDRFLRLWPEISISKFSVKNSSSDKWYPYNKGGGNLKWYGLREYVVNWSNNGYEIKNNIDSRTGRIRSHNYNGEYAFKECLTWSAISSEGIAVRYCEDGFLWDSKGACGFSKENLLYSMGLINSCVSRKYLTLLSPTLDIKVGDVIQIPFISKDCSTIEKLVNNNITISRQDWDSHENSWDFKTNELLRIKHNCGGNVADLDLLDPEEAKEIMDKYKVPTNGNLISDCLAAYKSEWTRNFKKLHYNEEELNRKFIEIYGLQDELTSDVPLDEITILQQGEISIENNEIVWHADAVIKQLISYAVGCMMGRYSIDKPGLILANQGDGIKQYEDLVPSPSFKIDDDGIIPLMASDSGFADNATVWFKKWLTAAFGQETLVENLNFIEGALGKSIDDYFVKDFWKDHKKMYQNRPIYWLFSSKKGAFQCLVYMHRMNAFTAGNVRTQYLLPYIEHLVKKQAEMEANAAQLSPRERKELDNIGKQIAECREYQDQLHVVADQQIDFDLDDGVVENYAKFSNVLSPIK